ncbi:MAG: M23 family metallopeptidase [Bacteroidetes bacterium]|nr:M23 family metallopeptidase [Bacteroidota bacterium]MCW5894631.1 M23 family metallopeptidase [Bacteroidota bacterium]
MPLLGNKRRKKSRAYEILLVPKGDGSSPRSFKAGTAKFTFWGSAIVAVFFLVFLLVFRFTPLGVLVGVTPVDEARKRAEEETRARIESLAEEIGILKDYNTQLRKALGDKTETGGSAPQQTETQTAVANQQEQIEQQNPEVASPARILQTGRTGPESGGGLRASFPLLTPVEGIVTQRFNPEGRHYGIDFAAKQGTPVYAAAHGYVVFSSWTYEYGNVVMLSHGNGYMTVYKHNSSILKTTGSVVRRGEPISLVGNTGVTSTGPHLHFEVIKDGLPQDPMEFLLVTQSAL